MADQETSSASEARHRRDLELMADAATAWLELSTEQEIFTSLAETLRQVIGEDVIISVSDYDQGRRSFAPRVVLGLGSLVEKITALLGRTPLELTGDFPSSVKRAFASGRLTQIPGGVVELGSEAVPAALCRQAAALLGLEEVHVVGFAKKGLAGGVCIMARRPDLALPRATIEALSRLAAVTIERKRSEEALRARQEEHRILLDESSDPIFSFDADGTYRYVNQAFAVGVGRRLDEIIGKRIFDVFDKAEADRRFSALSHVFRSGVEKVIEVRVPRAEGDLYFVTTITPVKDEKGRVSRVICSSKDITGRKQIEQKEREAQEALRISEATVRNKLRTILEPEGDLGQLGLADILDVDALRSMMEEHFRLTGIGSTVQDAAGNNLVAVGWQDICARFHRAHAETAQNCLESDLVLSSGAAAGTFRTYRCKNNLWDMVTPIEVGGKHLGNVYVGQFFYEDEVPDRQLFIDQAHEYGFDETEYLAALERVPRWSKDKLDAAMAFNAKLAGMISSLSYTTIRLARALAEKDSALGALVHSHDLMRYIIEHNRSAIAVFDLELRYLYVSRRYLEDFRIEERDLIGRRHQEVFPHSPHRVKDAHRRALAGEVISAEDDEYRWQDGTTDWINWDCRPWRDADGAIGGLVMYIEFNTERKRAEEERQRLQAELFHAQKMEAIGTLAGGVAHDFNNILGGILGGLSLLELELGEGAQCQTDVQDMKALVGRGADLAKQLLGFARRGKYDVKPLDLARVLEKTCAMFGRTRRDITIQLDVVARSLPVLMDHTQLEQVLLNLLLNAGQAMPDGGRLFLRARNRTLAAHEERPPGTAPGSFVELVVADTGLGMDAATQARIFEPFFTTRGPGQGTGLGLASVYGILQSHAGSIRVESAPGQGATFTLLLPAAEGAPVAEPTPAASVARGKGTILVVDDEEPLLKVCRRLLGRLGYEVLTASGGREAIERVRQNPGRISLVILDMTMPELNGARTFARLRELEPGLKVLLASGFSVEGQAQELLERGCNGFIQKPFSLAQLSAKLQELL